MYECIYSPTGHKVISHCHWVFPVGEHLPQQARRSTPHLHRVIISSVRFYFTFLLLFTFPLLCVCVCRPFADHESYSSTRGGLYGHVPEDQILLQSAGESSQMVKHQITLLCIYSLVFLSNIISYLTPFACFFRTASSHPSHSLMLQTCCIMSLCL